MAIHFVVSVVSHSIFLYVICFILFIISLIVISAIHINYYVKKNSYVTFRELLISPHAPGLSVIMPVFNQEDTIINLARTLFALQYNNFEIIIVNDGSTDLTLQKLKEFYGLEAVELLVNEQLKSEEVLTYYKSTNPAFSRLTIVDKKAGGRADALNAGINISEMRLVVCMEADCMLDRNALLKLVKPVLEHSKKVIYVGAALHVANSCHQKNAFITSVNFPRQLLPAFQVIEYLKLFLVDRLAWSSLNGIHSSSGALALFDREILIQSGGYNSQLKQPGFDVLIKMCRFMYDNALKYKVSYIPDPICWVNVPCKFKTLRLQRKQWAKETYTTFFLHKDLFFNSRYKLLGLINFPYIFISEWLTPLLKMLSIVLLGILAVCRAISLENLAILLALLYLFKVFNSMLSILISDKAYRLYSSGRDTLRMVLLAFLEPIVYHPLIVYWKIMGHFK